MKLNARLFEIDFTSNPDAYAIVKSLWARFCADPKIHTPATSSFWRHYGENARVVPLEESKSFLLGGLYAGDYENKSQMNLFDLLKNFPVYLSAKLAYLSLNDDWQAAVRQVSSNTNRIVNPDFVRIARSCQSLVASAGSLDKKRVIVIGDGFGTCGSLIRSVFPNASILYINLGRSLVFDISFTYKAFPEAVHVGGESELNWELGSFTYLPAEDLKDQTLGGDVYIAMETFQEMDLNIIRRYFSLMRREKKPPILYSANRTSKTLPDGTVINNKDFGWESYDQVLSHSIPWWLNWGVRRRPPFLFHMDGKVEETIAIISNS